MRWSRCCTSGLRLTHLFASAILVGGLLAWEAALAAPLFESGSFDLPATDANSTFQTVTFQQTYDRAPLVFAVATNEGIDPSSLRIRHVTRTGFEVLHLEPGNLDGTHGAMTDVAYFAVTPGTWEVAPGVFLEAGSLDTDGTVFKGTALPESSDWQTVSLSSFASAPAVQVFTQTMNSEENGDLPDGGSVPWLTNAVRNLGSGSFETALDRAEADGDGGTVVTETIGYVALTQTDGTLDGFGGKYTVDGGSVLFDSLISADGISGWADQDPDGDGVAVPFNQTFSTAPLVVASMARRDGGDGGWIRRGEVLANQVKLTVDEDTFVDDERGHTPEAASVFAFERAFYAYTDDGVEVGWDNDAGDGQWRSNVNWRVNNDPAAQTTLPNNVLPTTTDTVVVAGFGAVATQAGDGFEVATLRIGADASATLGVSGDGEVNVAGGQLTIHDALELGQDGFAGTLHVSGGVARIEGGASVGTGTGTVNVAGGTLVLAGTDTARQVTDYNQTGGTLLLSIADPAAGVTPLDVAGAATFSAGAVVDAELDLSAVGNAADPAKSVSWVGTAGSWDDKNNWETPAGDHVLPSGAATIVISPGDPFVFLQAPTAGDIVGPGNITPGPGWNVTPSGNQLQLESLESFGTGAVAAIIDKADADAVRDSDLLIAPEDGADATSLDVGAGALTVHGELMIGNTQRGTVTQTGGTVTVDTLSFSDTGSGDRYLLRGGTLDVGEMGTAGNGRIEMDSGASFNFNGTDLTLNELFVGHADETVQTTFTLKDGQTLDLDSARLMIGEQGGRGRFVQEPNTAVTMGRNGDRQNLVLGGNTDKGVVAEYEMQGGTMDVTRQFNVGNAGEGFFDQQDGVIDVGWEYQLGLGTHNMQGGELNVGTDGGGADRDMRVGKNGGATGTFNMTGGTVTVERHLEIADVNNGGTVGIVSISDTDAPASVTVGQDVTTDGAGTAQLDVGGGAELNIGRDLNLSNNGGGTMTVNLAGNSKTTIGGNLNYRGGGADTVNVSDSAELSFTGSSIHFENASDRLNLSGGTLDMHGGAMRVTEADGSQFNWTGGTLLNLGTFEPSSTAGADGLAGTGGLTTPDVSGGNHHGAVGTESSMTVAALVAGKVGSAIDFDGGNDSVSFGSQVPVLGDPNTPDLFSVAMWFQFDSDPGGESSHNIHAMLFGQGAVVGNDNIEVGLGGHQDDDDKDVGFYFDSNTNNNQRGQFKFDANIGDPTDGQWHHLALTFDAARNDTPSTESTVEVYLDGQLLGTLAPPSNATGDTASDEPDDFLRAAGNEVPFGLGLGRIGSDNDGDWDGRIDEFSLWGRALTATEIQRLYTAADTLGSSLGDLLADGADPFDGTALAIYAPLDTLDFDPAFAGAKLVQSGGAMAPGDPIGMTTVLGSYDQNAGTLQIGINGYDQGDQATPDGAGYDFVDLTGSAVLEGLLEVELLDGFVPLPDDAFDVVTAAMGVTLGESFDLVQPDGMLPATSFRYRLVGSGTTLQLYVGVPEPGTLGLALLAAVCLALYGWRIRCR